MMMMKMTMTMMKTMTVVMTTTEIMIMHSGILHSEHRIKQCTMCIVSPVLCSSV